MISDFANMKSTYSCFLDSYWLTSSTINQYSLIIEKIQMHKMDSMKYLQQLM